MCYGLDYDKCEDSNYSPNVTVFTLVSAHPLSSVSSVLCSRRTLDHAYTLQFILESV